MIRTTILTATLGALALTATGCNTVKGLGRDIESVGQKGEDVLTAAPREGEEDVQVAR